ncbi:MAG: M20/M25/M40 family metallo-hydrolase [Pseudomonadota bacterium]
MQINAERLSRSFVGLCEIDSPSRGEAKLARYLRDLFSDMGAESIIEDKSTHITGSDTGNIVVRFDGGCHDLQPVCFNCHLDVVNPCIGVKVRKVDGVFYSDGSTVLGGDDKAGIAVLIETLLSLQEQNIPFAPVELLFTTCEEIGLLGAKAFDPSILRSVYGYALDSTGIDNVVVGAPASHAIVAEIHGLASHAGLRPRHGINAIQIAARALADLPLGQLDDFSTANVGVITGGTATNIIPAYVRIDGEIRSHDAARLCHYLNLFRQIFAKAVDGWTDPRHLGSTRPALVFHAPEQYPVMRLSDDALPVVRAQRAAATLSRSLDFVVAGGGSDANIFNAAGIPFAILGIGMEGVHSTSEAISLAHMIRTAELVSSLLTC